MHTTLKEVITADAPDVKLAAEHEAAVLYVSSLAAHLINVRDFEPHTWKDKVPPRSYHPHPKLLGQKSFGLSYPLNCWSFVADVSLDLTDKCSNPVLR